MLWLQAYCSSYRLLEALFGVDPDHCRMPIWHWHRARHIAVLLKQINGTDGTLTEEARARREQEDRLLEGHNDHKEQSAQAQHKLAGAAEVHKRHAFLSKAFTRPVEEPAVPLTHWSYLLKEMEWLAADVAQERLWKRAVAHALAHEAASADRKALLQRTAQGRELLEQSLAREKEFAAERAQLDDASPKQRLAAVKARKAGVIEVSVFDQLDINGDLRPPGTPLRMDLVYTYKASADLPGALSYHLQDLAEAAVIAHEQEIREYDFDVDAARKAAAAAALAAQQAEELRMAFMERDLLGDGVYDSGDAAMVKAAKAIKRKKQSRLPASYSDDFVGYDEEEHMPGHSNKRLRVSAVSEGRDRLVAHRRLSEPMSSVGQRKPGRDQRRRDKAGRERRSDQERQRAKAAIGGGLGGQVLPWTVQEDRLLCAVVHEFGSNWLLVADVLASSTHLQGIYRKPKQCAERFKQLSEGPSTNAGVPEESAQTASQITKGEARELISKSLPVPDDVLRSTSAALYQVATKHRQQRQAERRREQERAQNVSQQHPSHTSVQQAAMAKYQGRAPTPADLIDIIWQTQRAQEEARRAQLEAVQKQQQAAAQQAQLQQHQAGGAGGVQALPAGTGTQGTAGPMGQQLPTQQQAMPPGSMPPPTTSMQAVAQQQGATICNDLAHLLVQAVAQQQGASGTLGMAPPQQQQPPGPQASQAGAPMGGSPLLGQAGSGGLQGMPNGQMQGLGASKRGPCVLPGPHAINNAGPAVQMQGPGASMAGGLLNQPIGVAGGMPAPAPIPTQQLQTQYSQLMAYIAQQQKALQTCTLVLQAGKAGPNELPLTAEQRQRYAQMQVEAQRRLQDGQQKLLLTQKAMQVLSQNGQLTARQAMEQAVQAQQQAVQAQVQAGGVRPAIAGGLPPVSLQAGVMRPPGMAGVPLGMQGTPAMQQQLAALAASQGMPRPNMAFNMGGLSRPGMPHPGQMSPTMMASGMPVIPSLQAASMGMGMGMGMMPPGQGSQGKPSR
eukprot:jgi/Astpho2/6198/Aster-x1356